MAVMPVEEDKIDLGKNQKKTEKNGKPPKLLFNVENWS